ncbi:MotA/TolQ/ExbB proton channel family protein [Blastopirellula sp. JC732]|uniref:MotA/TolQ/ExbB proton channel family protein n=1 Tax=Blastopirellula sediminis TaxID=2894196 RepID=A0A9X1MSS7_9BACT|nr:MotA/TolQ/ExbB proton channel family protein [Blastopirellula sediminis]MCC9604955.1 MotA/TolQ/ExbB proton channel family protein [Blastopirellula sediminis]MCC9631745.1 MotA/TolQ/ExbB proton channel family protein [Blastopirellula sediminis]
MTARNTSKFWYNISGKLGWPVALGLAASAGFYALINQGVINSPLVVRYFAGHPVEYIETAMFFVGLAAILLKLQDVGRELASVGKIELPAPPRDGQMIEEAASLLDQLEEYPQRLQRHSLWRRLFQGIEHVHVSGNAAALQEELKYFADQDAERAYQSYSLVRIVIWATPMLGFLGTVIGITLALGNLSPEALVNEPKAAMESLLAGLSVAFDTTALALSLSIFLMFAQFVCDRVENELITVVDAAASAQLNGRFQQAGGSRDPSVAAIQRMAERMMNATEQLVERQTQLWRNTIDGAHHHWEEIVGASKRQLEDSLTAALSGSLERHAIALANAEQQVIRDIRVDWQDFQSALDANARLMREQQDQLSQQGEIMLRAVEAVGEIASLEQTLSRNLDSLAGAGHFEETVLSLAATINLLNNRIGDSGSRRIELEKKPSQGHAA